MSSFDLFSWHDWDLISKLTSLNKISVRFLQTTDLSSLDDIMERLQRAVPSMKQMDVNFPECKGSEESCVDFLVQAKTFIKRHRKMNIQFDICFIGLTIKTHWRLDSKTGLSLPLAEYPTNSNELDEMEQWCSIAGLTTLDTYAERNHSLTMVPFTRATNSTVSTVILNNFSPEYEIVLGGFSSLKKLEIRYSILNKFPNLPESLRELTIEFVNTLMVDDRDLGIILPTQLYSLKFHGNMCCLTLPKILNVDELLGLKSVLVEICPFELNDKYDEDVFFNAEELVTREILRASNTCTIGQLQKFNSQLPSDLQTLKIQIEGYILDNLDDYSTCCPDKLSFEHFTNLHCLELNCFNSGDSFNVSVFPSADRLQFTSFPVLNGYFVQGIKSLEVNLQTYGESLPHLSHSISKLTSLTCLSINIDQHAAADLRKFTFPQQLCSFIIVLHGIPELPVSHTCGRVILDVYPIQLNHFNVALRYGKCFEIIVDDCKGETITSMAKKISVSDSEANWLQYSHFDYDEESFGIESLYVS
ncbi:unnamed protein product [Ambrosiozyma monospora]|uniref:Unnamed protein product n=1 Tax=Ambrosiozyma monospora TaxID=43982 RepID=A0ACB5T3P3_AMBMO|nr:unnamed protein product [Ambrosiozyma monospora]